jgi:hypothetical protein
MNGKGQWFDYNGDWVGGKCGERVQGEILTPGPSPVLQVRQNWRGVSLDAWAEGFPDGAQSGLEAFLGFVFSFFVFRFFEDFLCSAGGLR